MNELNPSVHLLRSSRQCSHARAEPWLTKASSRTWCEVNSSTVTDDGALMWSEDDSYLPEFKIRSGECGFNLWVRWRMFENNLYCYQDLWVAIKMEAGSDYEYVGPHISAAHRQRLVELRFEPGEPNGLQMLMALLPPGGRLIAYGNGMDALSAVAKSIRDQL